MIGDGEKKKLYYFNLGEEYEVSDHVLRPRHVELRVDEVRAGQVLPAPGRIITVGPTSHHPQFEFIDAKRKSVMIKE